MIIDSIIQSYNAQKLPLNSEDLIFQKKEKSSSCIFFVAFCKDKAAAGGLYTSIVMLCMGLSYPQNITIVSDKYRMTDLSPVFVWPHLKSGRKLSQF